MDQAFLEKLRRRPEPEEINAMPLAQYEGPIRLVRYLREWESALPDLTSGDVLGFDTETRPSFRKGRVNAPALIQLATGNAVYIIQLAWLPFGERIAAPLAHGSIIKAGVGIQNDMIELAKLSPFEPAALADLGNAARVNRLSTLGLRTLAANLFGLRISKGSQCSNWSLMELSRKQIAYAATDAWISRRIYLRMRELGLAIPLLPSRGAVPDRGSPA